MNGNGVVRCGLGSVLRSSLPPRAIVTSMMYRAEFIVDRRRVVSAVRPGDEYGYH